MSNDRYVYSSMMVGIADVTTGIQIEAFYVVRLWRGRMSKPDIICCTEGRSNTELVTDALNQTLGLSDEEASELIQDWVAEAA